jgi:hypothetical protein
MKRELVLQVGRAAMGVWLLTAATEAHHSYVEFDETRPVTLKGAVTKFRWENPHILIYVQVKNADGKDFVWTVEGVPPGRVRGRGMKDALKPGDVITISGSPSRNVSAYRLLGYEVTLLNGRTFIIGEESD